MSCVYRALCVFITVLCTGCLSAPLDDYVNKHDGHFMYKFIQNYTQDGCDVYVLNMTSQKWMDGTVSSRPVWFHYIRMFVPKHAISRDFALLVIMGGSNRGKPSKKTFLPCTLAKEAKMVGFTVENVPNEPITFWDDPKRESRKEDDIIGWTWKIFLQNSSNPEILLQMPMTKAVVRGMDAVTHFSKKIPGFGNKGLTKFVLTGASKRGWATWLTAAVDKRVVAISPIVFDLLNMKKNLHHHFKAYGNWSFAFQAYVKCNNTKYLDSKAFDKLTSIVDPYVYRDRLTMPKFVVSATGDEFFLPDDSHYYYDQMKGPIFLRIVPNAEHSMFGHYADITESITAFTQAIVTNFPLPQFTWTRQQTAAGGNIYLYSKTEPISVHCYYARTITSKRRDYRMLIANPMKKSDPFPQPIIWFKDNVNHLGNGTYVAEYRRPIEGFLAFLIEIKYRGPLNSTLTFTTELNIIPDVFPFRDCHGQTCLGGLV